MKNEQVPQIAISSLQWQKNNKRNIAKLKKEKDRCLILVMNKEGSEISFEIAIWWGDECGWVEEGSLIYDSGAVLYPADPLRVPMFAVLHTIKSKCH